MSETAVETMALVDTRQPMTQPRHATGLIKTWLLSTVMGIAPRWTARRWLRVPIWQAAVVAAVNMATLPLWLLVYFTTWRLWDQSMLRSGMTGVWNRDTGRIIRRAWENTRLDVAAVFSRGPYASFMSAIGLTLLAALVLALAFFVLLPFAVRPGRNKACVMHVLRAALLSSAFVHWWMAALTATIIVMIVLVPPGAEWMPAVFAMVCVCILWTLWSLIRAVRLDYRTTADMPAVKTPQCDECGYDLHMTDPAGRCPECGKPVAESLQAGFRKPTPWESDPRPTRLAVIYRQTRDVIVRPRDLFFGMTTHDGQHAAQRWLILWMVLVAALVFWTVPAMTLLLRYGWVSPNADRAFQDAPRVIEWSPTILITVLIGGITLGVLWALFGMMMVGIETAGVVLVAHFRGNKVPLAASAKVTCYSSPLMALWGLLGGSHVLFLILLNQRAWMVSNFRIAQLVLVGSTAIAHIGGLLWFEWTVYRGLKGIQYANH